MESTPDLVPGEEVISGILADGVLRPDAARPRGREGRGPFERLEIRDVTIVDGTGARPYGPATVVVHRDRIVRIVRDPVGDLDDRTVVIDGRGRHVLPGFVDAHAHLDSSISAGFGTLDSPEYVLKLWLAHGITTVRDVGTLLGLEWTLEHARLSEAGVISAPRIFAYPLFPQLASVAEPATAREWVRAVRRSGAHGIKFILDPQSRAEWKIPLAGTVASLPLEAHLAAIDEARQLDLRIAVHHGATQPLDALDHARLGVTSVEHLAGIVPPPGRPDPRTEDGFEPPPVPPWAESIAEMVGLDLTIVPTLAIHEARRDFMRASRAEWIDDYAMPALRRAFAPNLVAHGSHYVDATTESEIAWRRSHRDRSRFVAAYHSAGGRVAAGSDAGFLFQLYGFGFIRELEMLREAGLSPLDVVQAATRSGAELLGSDDFGTIEPGKKADLIVVGENPLENLKTLYGTRHLRYDEELGGLTRVGGIRHTIRDGIVWDVPELLASVRSMVRDAAPATDPSPPSVRQKEYL